MINIPFLAIPLPTATDNHQLENAKYYEKKVVVGSLDQKDFNKKK